LSGEGFDCLLGYVTTCSEQLTGHSVTHSKMNAGCGSSIQHKDENCHPHQHCAEIIRVILYPHRNEYQKH
jgi:hypothetical protein